MTVTLLHVMLINLLNNNDHEGREARYDKEKRPGTSTVKSSWAYCEWVKERFSHLPGRVTWFQSNGVHHYGRLSQV